MQQSSATCISLTGRLPIVWRLPSPGWSASRREDGKTEGRKVMQNGPPVASPEGRFATSWFPSFRPSVLPSFRPSVPLPKRLPNLRRRLDRVIHVPAQRPGLLGGVRNVAHHFGDVGRRKLEEVKPQVLDGQPASVEVRRRVAASRS